jgi:hypothetical protein
VKDVPHNTFEVPAVGGVFCGHRHGTGPPEPAVTRDGGRGGTPTFDQFRQPIVRVLGNKQ